MDWTDEDVHEAGRRWATSIRAVMDYAVELAAERGGTTTANAFQAKVEQLENAGRTSDFVLSEVARIGSSRPDEDTLSTVTRIVSERDALRAEMNRLSDLLDGERQMVSAFKESTETARAENQRLLSEAERLRVEVEEWKVACQDWTERCQSAEFRLAAIRERAMSEEGREKACEGLSHPINVAMAVAQWVLEGDAAQGGKTTAPLCGAAHPSDHKTVCADDRDHAGPHSDTGDGPALTWARSADERYPCSSTCTHDEAKHPWHPARVKERSEAVIVASRANDEHPDALPDVPLEVVDTYERGEAAVDAEHPEPELGPKEITSYEAGYSAGAEAMRAACWEAVQEQLQACGFTPESQAWRDFKAAIEGAVP